MWVRSLRQEDPLELEMATHSSIFPGESHGQRSLVGYGVAESDTTERTHTLSLSSHLVMLGNVIKNLNL